MSEEPQDTSLESVQTSTMSTSRSKSEDMLLKNSKPSLPQQGGSHTMDEYTTNNHRKSTFETISTISPPPNGLSHNDMARPKNGDCYVYTCTMLACLSSILLGYDIGVMSGAIVYLERDLHFSKIQSEIVVSALNLTSTFGALGGGQIATKLGRKKTVAISALIFLIGALLMALTSSFGIILLSRVLLGLAAGTGLFIAPLYAAELSPAKLRGKLVTFCEISINVGILLGYLAAWSFRDLPDDLAWRWMVGVGSFPSLILFCGMLVMPESPRWLVEKGYKQRARIVLLRILSPVEVEIQLDEIKKAINIEKSQMESGWKEILCCCIYKPPAVIRHALIIGVGVSFFQQATGNEAAVYWTPKIFEKVGLNTNWIFLATVFVGIAKVSGIFVATFLLDKVGRRPLLLSSAIIMTASLTGLGIAFSIGTPVVFTISMQCLFCASFSIGWGPITWVVMSEVFPLTIRSRAMSVCTVVNRLMSGTVALTFLSLQDAITPAGAWFFYTGISVISVGFVFFLVPETKGKSLEEITRFLLTLRFSDITGGNAGGNTKGRVEYGDVDDMQQGMSGQDSMKQVENGMSGMNGRRQMEMIDELDKDEKDEEDNIDKNHNNNNNKNKNKKSKSNSPIEPISKDDKYNNNSGYGSTNESNEDDIGTRNKQKKQR